MTFATESVTQAGSGLTFINDYGSSVTGAYRAAILAAEGQLQSQFTNTVTVNISFDLQPLDAGSIAQNEFSTVSVSYAQLVSALRAHATTTADFAAVGGLPAADPSGGAGFAIPIGQAVILGLTPQTNATNDSVTLSSSVPFTFGQDAIGALEHEITEGVFGRIASLGFDGQWTALDLFRFTAGGQRDYTGGSDGVTTFFGVNSSQVSTLAYHSSISATGANDGFDLGDWDSTRGDAFGPGGPGSPGVMSQTDLQVLDVLGWTPAGSGAAPATPDDYASSLTDTTHPFGALAVGGSATGVLETAGDRDWFQVSLQAGATYTISLTGQHGGGGTLGDPYLRLLDSSGAELASNDDIVSGANPDSRISFTAPATGTYFVDAAAFADGYAGSYRLTLTQTGVASQAVAELQSAVVGILRWSDPPVSTPLAQQVSAGSLSAAQAVADVVQAAGATTSVATLSYEFFTGKAPSATGMDYLVSPNGPNANNLNSSYYQAFNLENRYINFAVNLGKLGEGNATFTARYGTLSLFDATKLAYATIFGAAPSDAKTHALLDPTVTVNGQTETRADYFAAYGQDGVNGIGTKAAMVGWLLAEAEKADLGTYALSNDAFLTDVGLHSAPFGVDLVGQYSQPGFVYHPG